MPGTATTTRTSQICAPRTGGDRSAVSGPARADGVERPGPLPGQPRFAADRGRTGTGAGDRRDNAWTRSPAATGSPLGRAQHTARVVAEAVGLPVEVDAELAEISIGRWEGLTRQEVDERYPGERARRMHGKDRLGYRYAGGESLTAARRDLPHRPRCRNPRRHPPSRWRRARRPLRCRLELNGQRSTGASDRGCRFLALVHEE